MGMVLRWWPGSGKGYAALRYVECASALACRNRGDHPIIDYPDIGDAEAAGWKRIDGQTWICPKCNLGVEHGT